MKNKVFRALQLIFAPIKLLVLVGCVLALMVYVNYTVDCSGLYQGDLVNRTIVELLLDGKHVTDYGLMDDRAVLNLYAQLLPEDAMPETIALGSSRVMQVTKDTVGTSFFNCGMSGADYRDILNQYYTFVKNGKTPARVILSVDPWLFRADALNRGSNEALYAEACAMALGYETGYTPPVDSNFYKLSNWLVTKLTGGKTTLPDLHITSETLPALFEPAYFQGNVQYLQKNKDKQQATTEDGEVISFAELAESDLDAFDSEARMADGSVWYSHGFRNQTQDQILATANAHAGTFLYMLEYPQLETAQCTLFEDVVDYMQSCGSQVYFLLSPYHPHTYQYQVLYNYASTAGFFQVEPYVRAYAAQKGIPVIGSYSPFVLGLNDMDFYDGLHVRTSAIQKYFGGIAADGSVLPGSEGSYQDISSRDGFVMQNHVTGAVDVTSLLVR